MWSRGLLYVSLCLKIIHDPSYKSYLLTVDVFYYLTSTDHLWSYKNLKTRISRSQFICHTKLEKFSLMFSL